MIKLSDEDLKAFQEVFHILDEKYTIADNAQEKQDIDNLQSVMLDFIETHVKVC